MWSVESSAGGACTRRRDGVGVASDAVCGVGRIADGIGYYQANRYKTDKL